MTSLIDLEPAACGEKQFGTCDLGDVRWTQRLVRYAQQMAEKREASKLRQTEDCAGCKAVYRLFERAEVTFASVTAAHDKNTRTLPGRCLNISDTTEIDDGYKSKRKGHGSFTAWHRWSFFLHSALVVDAESHQVMELGPGIQSIHDCDRGAHNFDVFTHLYLNGDSWVIRAAQLKRKLRTAGAKQKLTTAGSADFALFEAIREFVRNGSGFRRLRKSGELTEAHLATQ